MDDNKLGKNFKEQTWYSTFRKPVSKLFSKKKKGLKAKEKRYDKIQESLTNWGLKTENGEKYKLREELGSGSYGVVYCAKRISDEKEVCTTPSFSGK